jgi:hypothetical protein
VIAMRNSGFAYCASNAFISTKKVASYTHAGD